MENTLKIFLQKKMSTQFRTQDCIVLFFYYSEDIIMTIIYQYFINKDDNELYHIHIS